MLLENDKKPAETGPQKFLRYFNLLMTLVYPVMGTYILLSAPEQIQVSPGTKKILGIMLILYGLYRFYRTYVTYFRPRNGGQPE